MKAPVKEVPTESVALRSVKNGRLSPIKADDATLAFVIAQLRASGCVFAEEEALILVAAASTSAGLADLLRQRASGQPLEHVVGWAEFCGLRISVGPEVFVPRRRTEFLVHQAAAVIGPDDIVVDLCCGSGAVGVALLHLVGEFTLHAVDIDARAVEWARRNVAARGHVHEGDLYDPLPIALQGRVNVIVGNAPYVPSAAIDLMPREARLYEPLAALDGGADGLDVQRRVVRGARQWLAPDGYLLVETSERQAPKTVELFARDGLAPQTRRSDDLDATVVIGSLAPRKPSGGSL